MFSPSINSKGAGPLRSEQPATPKRSNDGEHRRNAGVARSPVGNHFALRFF
jgi:hypothetical protein